MKSLFYLTQFYDSSWRLYFRFLRKREERGNFIYDEAITWTDAMAIAFNKREKDEKIDYADFHNEIHNKHLSLRACGVKIPCADIEIFRAPFNYSMDWIFTRKHYKEDSILDTSAIELCSHILLAHSKEKNTLLDFAKFLNSALDKIQVFIAENYSNPYFEVINYEQLPEQTSQTSNQGYPVAFFKPYYPYYSEASEGLQGLQDSEKA